SDAFARDYGRKQDMIAKQIRSRAQWRHLLMVLMTLVALLLPAIPARAMVGPTVSTPTDLHPNPLYPYVAAVWLPSNQNLTDSGKPYRTRATGFLVAPNVLLTEGNSYQNGQKVLVSFQSPVTDFTDEQADTVYSGYIYEHPKAKFNGPFERQKDMAV